MVSIVTRIALTRQSGEVLDSTAYLKTTAEALAERRQNVPGARGGGAQGVFRTANQMKIRTDSFVSPNAEKASRIMDFWEYADRQLPTAKLWE